MKHNAWLGDDGLIAAQSDLSQYIIVNDICTFI